MDNKSVGGAMRVDRFLWWARLAKTRSAAQAMAETGRMRIDGRTIDRAHCPVRPGNILTFAAYGQVRVVRIETLPGRRGPPAEARESYTELTPGGSPGPREAANVSQQDELD